MCSHCGLYTNGIPHRDCEERAEKARIAPLGDDDPRFAYFPPGHVLGVGDWCRTCSGWNGPIGKSSVGRGTAWYDWSARYKGRGDGYRLLPPRSESVRATDWLSVDGFVGWKHPEAEQVGNVTEQWIARK